MIFRRFTIIYLFLFLSVSVFAQTDEILGIKLRPELLAIVKEIERKSGEEIYAEFVRHKDYMFGSSLISEDGIPVVLIDFSLEDDAQKLEAVIAHELLHLRLRVNGYPTFLFSPNVQTAKGRAIDTEQGNINDLKDLIEHRIFKSDLEKFGLNKFLDLAGDTADGARKDKGKEGGQDDAINYARAILEYPNTKDIEEVRRIYAENKWINSIKTGKAIADIISASNLQTPKDAERVFLKCLLQLYPPPAPRYTFKLTQDANKTFYRRMIVSTATQTVRRKNR